MGLSTSTSKQILLLVNFILAVLGIVLVGFGIFVLISASESDIDNGENVAGGLVISLGALTVVIAIFGCLAAIHESHGRLIIYVVVLVVLILLQLIICSMVSLDSKDGLAGGVRDGFDYLWQLEHKDPGSLAYYEESLLCCGVNGTEDYKAIGHAIPQSCCLAQNCSLPTNIHGEGCQEKFKQYLYDKFRTFTIVCYILILLEIVGAALGWILLRNVQNESRRSRVGWM